MRWIYLPFLTISIISSSAIAVEDDIFCGKPNEVCRQKGTFLPLRALPRPFSNLYNSPNNTNILFSNVKAFYPLYVFDRKNVDYSNPANPTGWYKVGASVNDPLAWMQAKDIMEWKQALVVSYTHPGTGENRRNPVLMYENIDDLKKLMESSNLAAQAKNAYQGLEKTPIEVPQGVISMETKRFVDIETKKGFYILPVLKYKQLDIFDDATRYLQIAAAIPRERAETADTLKNQEYVTQATESETIVGTQAQSLGVDIKFVMDITGSMSPYLKATKEAIKKLATQVVAKIDTSVNFGLIGYNDNTTNFIPKLSDADYFVKIISTIEASGGGDYQEEVFAGVKQAIESHWNENTIKVIVIIGDASSHKKGHPKNLTNMNAEELNQLASANKIAVMAVHLKAKGAKKDHPIAKQQFTALAKANQLDNYIPLDANNVEAFEATIKSLSEQLSLVVADVRSAKAEDKIDAIEATVEPILVDETITTVDKAEKVAAGFAKNIAATALVEYLGSAAKPPRDVTVWVLDRDMIDPTKRSLDVRLLIKKSQLNDLITALEQILMAIKRSELTAMQFFDALQGVVTSAGKGEKISFKKAKKLKAAGLLPSWIASLPYKSEILEMDNDSFEALSPDERGALEDSIDAKLQLYREINESDLWISLDDRHRSDEHVYPLSLDLLP